MKVYVDELRPFTGSVRKGNLAGRVVCHLLAESFTPEAVAALHELAGRIGCPRFWAQLPPHAPWPTYLLSAQRRSLALRQGAVPITAADAARLRQHALRRAPIPTGFDDDR